MIVAHDDLLILTTNGTLFLAPASPDGFEPRAKAVISKRVTRALPALSNGRFYFRDNDPITRNGQLHCLLLSER
jgi:hypothetical protein